MALSFTTKTTIAGLLVLAMLVVVSFLTFQQSNEVTKAAHWVEHTYEVLTDLESLRSEVAENNAAERGYVVAGTDTFRQMYRTTCQEMRRDCQRIEELTFDNVNQRPRMQKLCELIAKESRLADEVVGLRQANSRLAEKEVADDRGAVLTNSIFSQINDLETEEKQLLSFRDENLLSANRSNLISQTVLILSSLLMLVAANVLARRYAKDRERSENSLRTSKLRFTGIFQQSFQFIWLLNTEGVLMQANQTALDSLNLQRETEVGKLFWNTAWWINQEESQLKLKETFPIAAKGLLERLSVQVVRDDRSVIDLDFSFKPLVDDDGQVSLIIAEGRDITDFRTAQARLKENQARLNAIFSSMAEGLYQLDAEGRLLYLNPAGARMLGYDSDSIIGQSMHKLIHEDVPGADHLSAEECPILNVMREGTSIQGMDGHFKRRDGTALPVQYYSAPLVLDGQIKGAVVTFADITTRKEAQRRTAVQYTITHLLSQAESVQEVAPQILEQICSQFGWDAAVFWQIEPEREVLRAVDFWHAPAIVPVEWETDCKQATLKRGERLAGKVWLQNAPLWIGKQSDTGEQQLIPEAAQAGLISCFGFPVRSDETILGVIVLLSRETREPSSERLQILNALGSQFGQFIDRKNTESRLKDRELQFQQLADNVEEIFWIWSTRERKLLYVSPAYEEVWGRSCAELYARPTSYFEAVIAEDRERVREEVKQSVSSGATIEYRIRRPDGSIRWIWSRWTPIVSKDGQTDRLCGIVHDVTERKEVEKRVNEFYSTVSHELRTPLTSIRASLGLLGAGMAGEMKPKAAKLINIALTESDRLIRLINDILDIRKIEAGKLELKMQRVLPAELVDTTFQAMQGIAEQAGVQLVSDLRSNTSLICDPDRTIQVLTNLVSNAIKFSPRDSLVTVAVVEQEESLRFMVSDVGSGIPEAQISKLFGLFQQLDSSDSRPKGGTGLGLAISKSIVEQHGGKIGVQSRVGEGSTFYFELPLTPRQSLAATQSTEASADGKPTVLIVEDDRQLATVLQELLLHEEYAVAHATTLAEAREFIASHVPAAIILDIQLPDGNGLTWMEQIRLEDRTQQVPIVIVTGEQSRADNYSGPFFN